MRYLVRRDRKRGKGSVVQADNLWVRHPEQRRTKAIRSTPIGNIREVEGTGKYLTSMLEIKLRGVPDPDDPGRFRSHIRGDGQRAHPEFLHLDATAADVKKYVRLIRPEEEAKIAGIDLAIEETKRLLREQRADREEAVREAFSKGHKVALKDVLDAAKRDDHTLA